MKELLEFESFQKPSPVNVSAKICVDVAVPLPVEGIFSYSVPEEMVDRAVSGVRVLVPFKNREITAYVVRKRPFDNSFKIKPILAVLDDSPVLSSGILDLTAWVSDYYACSWGEAIENALPKWVKYGKKAEKALQKQIVSSVPETLPEPPPPFKLSSGQERALEAIRIQGDSAVPRPILIHGVTGSGKSEIYIRAIQETLKRGRASICLVPEIALTEQIKLFFYQHFGDKLEVLHSKLADQERFFAWKRLESGERRVVLGPRSAVFAPVQNLGLIIMDEEHEGSYKQETVPRYHAREVAARRAAHEKAVFVMGTATPSLETMQKSEAGEIERVHLSERIDDKALPPVQILDLKQIMQDYKRRIILSPKLASEIEINLKKGEGTLLLLNRRGFSTQIQCLKCGVQETCASCQVSLTFHQEDDTLLCHYCNLKKIVPQACSECGAPVLKFTGFGTEKVESEVAKLFPTARILRLDADTVKKRGSHEKILKEFRQDRADILIGTQMIAKGFDFPNVTLVGVVLADVGLMLPDFRSAERTFQLLTQVAGRAGRGTKPGRVIIQTFSPQHPSVQFSRQHDFLNFFRHEIAERREYKYPPFYRLLNVIIRSKTEKKAYAFARAFRDALRDDLKGFTADNLEIIGPAPLPFYKLRGHFRWHVMLKFESSLSLSPLVRASLAKLKKSSGVQYAIDVDPLNIL